MIPAPIAENELARLKTLLDYKILDSPAEIEYDDITHLASEICQTPIAMVSLVDENRQWFKSRIGVDFNQSPRETSFCGHAIHQRQVFVVKDFTQDIRFFDNPMVIGETGVRFYAGAPLIAPNGLAVGTLCVVDTISRDLSSSQVKALESLSRQVVSQLELRKACHLLSENYEKLQILAARLHDQEVLLIHSTKMAALGEMAAGVAHEINNPLTIINGRAEQILNNVRKTPAKPEEIEKFALAISDTVIRIAKVIRGLLNFSGSAKPVDKSYWPIRNLIEDVEALVSERALLEGVHFEISPYDDGLILCSPTLVSQIFLNLINNAFDAISKLEEKWIRVSISKMEHEFVFKVTDSGSGIDPAIQNKIMQPFFTTKPIGQGIGLGLSISKGLAESEGGSLQIDPDCPNTCFEVRFPIVTNQE